MKNVVVISSSPRVGGNSDLLCDEFIRGAEQSGNNVEKIVLKERKVGYCTGCGVCFNTKTCSQKDDMEQIIDSMMRCDTIVLASPIYFYTMCGQLKTMIDRCCSGYTKLTNKDFYFILTAADPTPSAVEKAVTEFQGFLDCLDNAKCQGVIAGVGVWNKGDIVRRKSIMDEAFEKGKLL